MKMKCSRSVHVSGLLTLLALMSLPSILGPTGSRAATNRFVAVGGSDTSNDCSNSGNPCATIQHAINQSTSGDIIELGPGTYMENVTVNQSVTIRGDAINPSTVNGNNASPVFTVNSGVTASLDALTITNGKGGDDVGGGGINNSGVLTVSNSTITGNSAGGAGFAGGIFNIGELMLTNSKVTANLASSKGGGIDNGGVLIITNSTISGNQADLGAGIHNGGGTLSIAGSTISDNSALAGGAGGIGDAWKPRISMPV